MERYLLMVRQAQEKPTQFKAPLLRVLKKPDLKKTNRQESCLDRLNICFQELMN